MANVHSIPGSVIVKYHTEKEARNAYAAALADHRVVRVTLEHTRTVVVESDEEPLAISRESFFLHSIRNGRSRSIFVGPDLGVSTWRVVFIGREPGVFPDKYVRHNLSRRALTNIFHGRSHILENTNNVPGAHTQKYEEYDRAVQDFRDFVSIRKVIRVHWKLTRELLLPESE